MATFLTAFLAAVLGQAADEPVYQNTFKHQIPFSIQPERRAEIREIRLYWSSDKGATWQQYASAAPDKDRFIFDAPKDGEYWFRIAAVDLKGNQQPDNIYRARPESTIRIVIDSLKPVVKLVRSQRQGEEVTTSWEITEDHPDAKTLTLEYQVQGSPNWLPVKIDPGPTGTARIRPGSAAGVSLRMTFTDKAGNQSQTLAEVPGTTVATASFNPVSNPVSPPPVQVPPVQATQPAPVQPVMAPGAPAAAVAPPTIPTGGAPVHIPPPASAPDLKGSPPAREPAIPQPPSFPPRGETGPPGQTIAQTPLVASSEDVGAPKATSSSGTRSLPPIKYVNHREVALAYEITREGPSRVGSVELYWTPDDGKTWEKAPMPPVEDVVQNKRRQRIIDLQEGDGVYGFSLVIRSRAGLGKAPPRSGEIPEMRIELDTVKPLAQLFKPQADPVHHDTLILTWSAKDKNLSPTPVTLEWSERPDAPWQAIGVDLVNTGQYAWQLPSTMPVQVYLRLRVTDLAGNVGEAVTPEPQLVDLTEPEGHLVDVAPTVRRP
jgi:hypothetical protein